MSHVHPLQHAAAAARAGNSALAKIHLQKAAEADPDDPAVWLWMGWLSDSPMSMVQCLEMLLDNEQFRPAAEAGMYFAKTLAEFRYGADASASPDANGPGPAGATPAYQSSAQHAPSAPEPVAAAPTPQPTQPEAAVPVESLPVETLPVETIPAETLSADSVTPRQAEDGPVFGEAPTRNGGPPEIVFETPFDQTPVSFDANDQAGVPDDDPSLDGLPVSDDERQSWASFWAPGFTQDDTSAPVETPVSPAVHVHSFDAYPTGEHVDAVENTFQAAVPTAGDQHAVPASAVPASAVSQAHVIPTPPETMFRPARDDWFSPGGPSESHATPPAPPQQPTQRRSTPTPHEVPWSRPASPFNVEGFSTQAVAQTETAVAAPPNVDIRDVPSQTAAAHQPAYASPPPVWQRPAAVRPPEPSMTQVPPATHGAGEFGNPAIASTQQPSGPHQVAAGDGSTHAYSQAPAVTADPANTTILVVDDSPTVRKLVAMTLEKRGYRVATAFDGVAAIKEIAAQNPSLILMDVNMPRLDGYQLCKLVKKHDSTRHIPVIMLSGKDGMFDRLRGKLVGCTGYITKPFVPEALIETVERYLAQAARN